MYHRITPWKQETDGIKQSDNERILKNSTLCRHDLFMDLPVKEGNSSVFLNIY